MPFQTPTKKSPIPLKQRLRILTKFRLIRLLKRLALLKISSALLEQPQKKQAQLLKVRLTR